MQWSKTCFVDELWTMTGNGQKIGASPSSTIPQYFGMVEVLKIAEEVDSLRTAPEMKEALSRLSEENRAAIIKRLEETRQLAVRGLDIIDAGHTEEYTDEILSLSYEMSKDGLREALSAVDFTGIESQFPGTAIHPGYDRRSHAALESSVGAFLSGNKVELTLAGNKYQSITAYVASKMPVEAFNEIQEANKEQGYDSYKQKAVERKFAVLKSMGYDIDSYGTWDEMEKALTGAGFWTAKNVTDPDQKKSYPEVFAKIKADPSDFNACCQGQTAMDAAIQLILENLDMPGNDRNNHSMILLEPKTKACRAVK